MNNPRTGARGFTLIEVLVALGIVVISFLAMYGSAQQVVGNMTQQQEKTFASWVAFDQLTELRLLDQLPDGDRLGGEVEMADLEWRYVVEFNEVGSERMLQAIVSVSPADNPERIVAQVMGVLLREGRPPGIGNSGNILYNSAGFGGGQAGTDTDGDGIPDEPDGSAPGGQFDDVIDDATGSGDPLL